MADFVNVNGRVVNLDFIQEVRFSYTKSETVEVVLRGGSIEEVSGFQAVELMWLLKPSVLEGNTAVRWEKHYWAVHNLLAHPVMQLLAFAGLYKAAIWVHDVSVPKPIGFKDK